MSPTRSFRISLLIASFMIMGFIGALAFAERNDTVTGLAQAPDSVLRLHVLAHSDDPAEQQVKLSVRDALLNEMRSWTPPRTGADMERLLRSKEQRMVEVAQSALREAGFSHPVRVELGNFDFETRTTGQWTLPAGTYRAVRIIIGDGAGRNWWCVLFPPLCFVDDEQELFGEGSGRPGATHRFIYPTPVAEAAQAPRPTTEHDPPEPGRAPVVWRLRLWEALGARAAEPKDWRERLFFSARPE